MSNARDGTLVREILGGARAPGAPPVLTPMMACCAGVYSSRLESRGQSALPDCLIGSFYRCWTHGGRKMSRGRG